LLSSLPKEGKLSHFYYRLKIKQGYLKTFNVCNTKKERKDCFVVNFRQQFRGHCNQD